MIAALILFSLILLLLLRVPVAFTLGGLGLAMLVIGGFSPIMVPQSLYSTMDSFELLAVPMFLLMSNVLLKGGIGRDLFAAVQSWVGHWPGGLGVAAIVSCAIFAAISGSSVATAATIGNVAIYEMTSRGYARPFVLGLVAAGGTLGILIPPSIPLIKQFFVFPFMLIISNFNREVHSPFSESSIIISLLVFGIVFTLVDQLS